MSDQRRFDIPAGLEWKPPQARPVTEEKRREIQANLEYWKTFGGAIDRDFSVEEEMARRGLKTNQQVEAEEAAKKAAQEAADAKAVDAELAASIERTIGSSVERALRPLKSG